MTHNFATITNKNAGDCKPDDKTCAIQGKLILTSPSDNISYVLYRDDDKQQARPVVCTLPAQAAEALSSSRSVGVSIPVTAGTTSVSPTFNASNALTAQLVALGNNSGPALYVLAASFSLCMAYGSDAITSPSDYKELLLAVVNNAPKIVASAPATPTPQATPQGAATTFKIGGTVAGLSKGKSVTLTNNGTEDLTVSSLGKFTFKTGLADGADYAVTVKTNPDKQTCTTTAATGKVASSDVSTVQVVCK